MADMFAVFVTKYDYFSCSIVDAVKEVYLVGVFEEDTVRERLKEYFCREEWLIEPLPCSGETREVLIEQYIDEILYGMDGFIYNDVGTVYAFITERVELNELREESRDTCLLWYQ